MSVAMSGLDGHAQSGAPQTAEVEARRAGIREIADRLSTKAVTAPAPKNWRPPRTPWGDPDIEGVFTNNDERLIPFERPAEFNGRRLADITPQELARISEARRAERIDRLASEAPRDPGTIGWFEAWNARNSRAWLIVDPEDGRIPPRAATAQRRPPAGTPAAGQSPFSAGQLFVANYDMRCISRGLPGSMLPAFYGSAYEIHQSPGSVAIRYELIHETRVIPLDARPHVGGAIRTYMGDARARWEGDTLVIETTNFKDEIPYRDANGATLTLTERFTPLGPAVVQWSVTVDDPSTWSRPWTFAMNLTRTDRSQQPFEFACHEGNYSMRHALEAGR
jgi:hypothetical protein